MLRCVSINYNKRRLLNMAQDDYGNELPLDQQSRDEYQLQWCMAEAEDYINRHGIEKFLSELRKRLEQ